MHGDFVDKLLTEFIHFRIPFILPFRERTNTSPMNATINIGKSRIIHSSDGLHGPGWLPGLGMVGVCTSISMDISST
jgi:hypothetical protein